jgi:uncharacterized protein
VTTFLLDGNVLVALLIDSHFQHAAANAWFASLKKPRFATNVVTQGTLLRVHMATAADPTAAAAWRSLAAVVGHRAHVYWDDAFGYDTVPHRHLQGPKQVTDAWLAEAARRRKGKLATFDAPLSAMHRDVAVLLAA